MERPKVNRKAHRSAPVERSGSQLKILKIRQIGHFCIRAYKRPPVRAEPMKRITFLVRTHQTFTGDQGRTRIVMLFIGSAQNGGLLHGYKRAFDGFSGIFNWLPERATGSLLWYFLFILGRSIAWYTYVRMLLNHPVCLAFVTCHVKLV